MAQIIKDDKNKNNKKFAQSPCDKHLLLSSLKKHQPEGVILGVEKLIQPKRNKFGKVTIYAILTVVGQMEKLVQYELDEEGQYIEYEDELTGEKKRKLTIGDGNLKTVFFPFYANTEEEDGLDDHTTLVITPKTSSYSFFKEGLIDGGELPEDIGLETIGTNFAELKECLEGFTFRGKYEMIKGKNRSFPSLLVERVDEEDI